MSRPQYCPGWIVYHICLAMLIIIALSFFTCNYAKAETRWIAGPKLNNGYPYGAIGLEYDTAGTWVARWTVDLGGQEAATQPGALLRIKQFTSSSLYLNFGPNLELIQPDMDNTRRIALLSLAIGVEYKCRIGQLANLHAGIIRIQPEQAVKPFKLYLFISSPL